MNAVSEIPPTATTPPAPDVRSSTPGALLRHEREQRGLTVQQVSEELHLDAWLVEALEQNRFLALGAPVYAKGHLRKYAVLLGLSPDLILARYQLIAEPPPPVQLPPREALLTPEPMARGFDWRRLVPNLDWRGVDWRIYGILGGVLLTASGVWLLAQYLRAPREPPRLVQNQSQSQSPNPSESPPQSQAPDQSPNQPPDQTQRASQTTQSSAPALQTAAAAMPAAVTAPPPRQPARTVPPAPEREVRASASSPPAQSKPVSPPPVSLAANVPAKLETARKPAAMPPKAAAPGKPTPAVTQPRLAAAQPPVVAVKAPPQVAQPKPAVAAVTPPPIPEIPQVSLRLEFAVASWAEVYDGDGRRLLYAVGDPSRPRTVSGKPPLKVTLGMAGSVQARVNGRPIAIPRRIGQDSASFSVGASGSIR